MTAGMGGLALGAGLLALETFVVMVERLRAGHAMAKSTNLT